VGGLTTYWGGRIEEVGGGATMPVAFWGWCNHPGPTKLQPPMELFWGGWPPILFQFFYFLFFLKSLKKEYGVFHNCDSIPIFAKEYDLLLYSILFYTY
jgi:hypothetical protein